MNRGHRIHNAYKSQDAKIKEQLQKQIEITGKDNKELTPYVDSNYWCETCGSRDGKSHPITAMCFHCDADDWQPNNLYEMV